jgi:hypothetical protein
VRSQFPNRSDEREMRGTSDPPDLGAFRGAMEAVQLHPQSSLVRLACWLAVVSRVLLVVALLTTPVALVNYVVWEALYVALLAAFVISWMTYTGIAFALRCPGCRKRFLVEAPGPRHAGTRRIDYFGSWGTVVWETLRHQQFACMYCGEQWRVK